MSPITSLNSDVKLSICISTRNRAHLIRETLDSIIEQAADGIEIVVLDGASTDGTAQVISEISNRFCNLRYFRQETNNGLDRGFDEAVELAQGEYCWLMPDDDLLKPDAISTLMPFLYRGYSLVVANVEYRNFDMSSVVKHCDSDIPSNIEFRSDNLDGLFAACWKLIRYVGSIVIRREIWLSREKEKYYDSYWMSVCVIFQNELPGSSSLSSQKLISVRMNNQSWLSKWFEVFCVSWPKLVRTFPLSEETQRLACSEEPRYSFGFLLLARAAGQYSHGEYGRHIRPLLHSRMRKIGAIGIAILPGMILNTCFMIRHLVVKAIDNDGSRNSKLLLLTHSRFCPRWWRAARAC